jgi:hypothetical protein
MTMIVLGRRGSSRGREGEGTMDISTTNRRALMHAASGLVLGHIPGSNTMLLFNLGLTWH